MRSRYPLNGLLGVAALALFAGISLYLLPLEPNLLALQFSFTPNGFQAVIAQWQGDGLQRFQWHFWADFALLLCYGLWGYRLISSGAIARQLPPPWRSRAIWLLPLAAVSDAQENLLQLYLLQQPAAPAALYALAGMAALLKWLLLGSFALLLVWAWSRQRPAC
jgi:hypothetical protein